jgi:hypothetical protein
MRGLCALRRLERAGLSAALPRVVKPSNDSATRWAAETDNEEDRQAFLEMAKVWTPLAMHGPDGEFQTCSTTPPNGAPYQRTDSPEV